MRPPSIASPRRLLFVAGSAHALGGLASWLDYLLPGLAARGWDPVLGLVEGPRHHRPERMIEAHPHERWIRIPCPTGTPEGRRRAIAQRHQRILCDWMLHDVDRHSGTIRQESGPR